MFTSLNYFLTVHKIFIYKKENLLFKSHVSPDIISVGKGEEKDCNQVG